MTCGNPPVAINWIAQHQSAVDLLVFGKSHGFLKRGEGINCHHEETRPAAPQSGGVGGQVESSQGNRGVDGGYRIIRFGVSYHQMALGEAATTMPGIAHSLSRLNPEGRKVTSEAAIEGKVGGFYAGWGFYFVRKYLAEALESGAAPFAAHVRWIGAVV